MGAVFCLQEPGEHPYCGDGVGPSGFSYDPDEFMHKGSAWRRRGGARRAAR